MAAIPLAVAFGTCGVLCTYALASVVLGRGVPCETANGRDCYYRRLRLPVAYPPGLEAPEQYFPTLAASRISGELGVTLDGGWAEHPQDLEARLRGYHANLRMVHPDESLDGTIRFMCEDPLFSASLLPYFRKALDAGSARIRLVVSTPNPWDEGDRSDVPMLLVHESAEPNAIDLALENPDCQALADRALGLRRAGRRVEVVVGDEP